MIFTDLVQGKHRTHLQFENRFRVFGNRLASIRQNSFWRKDHRRKKGARKLFFGLVNIVISILIVDFLI